MSHFMNNWFALMKRKREKIRAVWSDENPPKLKRYTRFVDEWEGSFLIYVDEFDEIVARQQQNMGPTAPSFQYTIQDNYVRQTPTTKRHKTEAPIPELQYVTNQSSISTNEGSDSCSGKQYCRGKYSTTGLTTSCSRYPPCLSIDSSTIEYWAWYGGVNELDRGAQHTISGIGYDSVNKFATSSGENPNDWLVTY